MASHSAQRGALMIEVLITIVICVIGLWGLSEVQAKLQQSEVESYQRSHALLLLQDMASRISANRKEAYVSSGASPYEIGATSPLGPDIGGCADPAAADTVVERDLAEWCLSIVGAAETLGSSRVGSMIGARGCIEEVGGGSNLFMVSVVWQGMFPVSAPPASVACGAGEYDDGAECVNDLCRRAATTLVFLPDLTP